MALYFDGQKTLGLEQYDAVAYYRLSKDDGAKHESDSIANQRKVIRAFLQNNPNIHLVEEAQDDGYTGKNFDRAGVRPVFAVFCMRYNQKESTALLLRTCPDWAESISKRESILK